MSPLKKVLAIVGSLAALGAALWANPEVIDMLMPAGTPVQANDVGEPPGRDAAAGTDDDAETPATAHQDGEPAPVRDVDDDSIGIADAAVARPEPTQAETSPPSAERDRDDPEMGVQLVVRLLNEHARNARVICDSIALEGSAHSGLETYQVAGRGDPTGVASFLSRLENDNTLARLTSMRVRAADDGTLLFELSLNVVSAGRGG